MPQYIGNDHYISGVPQRDLTDAEWDALPADLQERAAPLYRFSETITIPDVAPEPTPEPAEETPVHTDAI